MLSPGAQPVPVTVVVVPRGPDCGEMEIAGLTATVVADCVGRLLVLSELDGDADGEFEEALTDGLADVENAGDSGDGVVVGVSAPSADVPPPDRVNAATPTPSSTATTSTAMTRIGEMAGLRSSSSSMASRTASTEGSTVTARSVTRSSIAYRASSGIAMTGSPAQSRRPFARVSRTSSQAGQLPTWRRSATARAGTRVPSASRLSVARSAGVRPECPASDGIDRES